MSWLWITIISIIVLIILVGIILFVIMLGKCSSSAECLIGQYCDGKCKDCPECNGPSGCINKCMLGQQCVNKKCEWIKDYGGDISPDEIYTLGNIGHVFYKDKWPYVSLFQLNSANYDIRPFALGGGFIISFTMDYSNNIIYIINKLDTDIYYPIDNITKSTNVMAVYLRGKVPYKIKQIPYTFNNIVYATIVYDNEKNMLYWSDVISYIYNIIKYNPVDGKQKIIASAVTVNYQTKSIQNSSSKYIIVTNSEPTKISNPFISYLELSTDMFVNVPVIDNNYTFNSIVCSDKFNKIYIFANKYETNKVYLYIYDITTNVTDIKNLEDITNFNYNASAHMCIDENNDMLYVYYYTNLVNFNIISISLTDFSVENLFELNSIGDMIFKNNNLYILNNENDNVTHQLNLYTIYNTQTQQLASYKTLNQQQFNNQIEMQFR